MVRVRQACKNKRHGSDGPYCQTVTVPCVCERLPWSLDLWAWLILFVRHAARPRLSRHVPACLARNNHALDNDIDKLRFPERYGMAGSSWILDLWLIEVPSFVNKKSLELRHPPSFGLLICVVGTPRPSLFMAIGPIVPKVWARRCAYVSCFLFHHACLHSARSCAVVCRSRAVALAPPLTYLGMSCGGRA